MKNGARGKNWPCVRYTCVGIFREVEVIECGANAKGGRVNCEWEKPKEERGQNETKNNSEEGKLLGWWK